ncbi:MAG: hypothetical protein ACR5K2_00425 [Wolbachia sp.]
MVKQFYTCIDLNEQPYVLAFLNGKSENIPKFHFRILPKLCGVNRVIDLLFYRPHSYVDRSKSLLDAQVENLQPSQQKFVNQPSTFRGGHIK